MAFLYNLFGASGSEEAPSSEEVESHSKKGAKKSHFPKEKKSSSTSVATGVSDASSEELPSAKKRKSSNLKEKKRASNATTSSSPSSKTPPIATKKKSPLFHQKEKNKASDATTSPGPSNETPPKAKRRSSIFHKKEDKHSSDATISSNPSSEPLVSSMKRIISFFNTDEGATTTPTDGEVTRGIQKQVSKIKSEPKRVRIVSNPQVESYETFSSTSNEVQIRDYGGPVASTSSEEITVKQGKVCPLIFGHRKVSVEPAMFFCVFNIGFSLVAIQHFLLIRTCRITMKYNKTICDLMETNVSRVAEYEKKTQPPTTTLTMAKSMLEAIGPAIMCLFLGPWSHFYGPYFLHFSILVVMGLVRSLHPYFALTASAPVVLSGGLCSFFIACTALLNDVTKPESLSLRLGILDACSHFGFFIGVFISGYVTEASGKNGYLVVFSTCAGMFLLTTCYVIIFVPESVPVREVSFTNVNSETTIFIRGGLFRNQVPVVDGTCAVANCITCMKNLGKLFHQHLFVDSMTICFKKRENYHRGMIIMQATVMASGMGILMGEHAVFYFMTRMKFSWDLVKFTVFLGVALMVHIFGTIFGIFMFSLCFHINDVTLVIAALTSCVASSIISAISTYDWFLYLAVGVQVFGGLVTPLSRSFISKNVPPDILGIVSCVESAVETLLIFMSVPVYVNVYNATFNFFPGMYFFISTFVYTVNIILTSIVKVLDRRYQEQSYYEDY